MEQRRASAEDSLPEEILENFVMTSALTILIGGVLSIGDTVRNIAVDIFNNHQTILDKTGEFGVDIYGIGIGTFVLSGGMIVAIQHIRERRQTNISTIEHN